IRAAGQTVAPACSGSAGDVSMTAPKRVYVEREENSRLLLSVCDVAPDCEIRLIGRPVSGRFLLIRPLDPEQPPSIRLTLNWFDELRRLVAARYPRLSAVHSARREMSPARAARAVGTTHARNDAAATISAASTNVAASTVPMPNRSVESHRVK